MNLASLLIAAALLLPLIGAVITFAVGRFPDVRETLTMVIALALAIVCGLLFAHVGAGERPELVIGEPLRGVILGFRLEPLGALFALMASVLWALNTLFSIGYMRSRREQNQTRFYACFALAMAGAMGVAMSANLFTLFIFYEVITLSTYPLVAHAGDAKARRAGRIYLGMLVGASVLLLLPAIIAVYAYAGGTDFVAGGLLRGRISPQTSSLLLTMLVFGVAKAAIFPVHGWLPTAMVAPAPVSALLHAVAVVKAGVFTLLKVSSYIFGADLMRITPASHWLVLLAAGTVVLASVISCFRTEIKARLAWSTIGQLAYITGAAMMGSAPAIIAGGLHMATHAFGKITLFMCAGTIYSATGKTQMSDLKSLGRDMPVLACAWTAAAMSIAGIPPLGGAVSKFLLLREATMQSEMALFWAMMFSSVISAAVLVAPGLVALMAPASAAPEAARATADARSANLARLSVAALAACAAGALALFFLASGVTDYLEMTQHTQGPDGSA